MLHLKQRMHGLTGIFSWASHQQKYTADRSCRAKQAKMENCTFFTSAAGAEATGFRPCLLCRPELAPGNAAVDANSVLAHKAAGFLEENCGSRQNLPEIARELGCTDRHLRRVFMEEYHVSPVQYLQTCRLLLAKNLLTDTALSVLYVAMAAGFGSLRRLNDLFQKHYGLSHGIAQKGGRRKEPGGRSNHRLRIPSALPVGENNGIFVYACDSRCRNSKGWKVYAHGESF